MTESPTGEDNSNPIVTETIGAVLVVTLNRPPANAIDAATSRELGQIFSRFRDDSGPAGRDPDRGTIALLFGGVGSESSRQGRIAFR